MTKDDIKKALEICADISIPCNDCPYDAIGNCTDTLCADALKIIIEQEKEIERLKTNISEEITDLLVEFDEMGFAPTTVCPNPDKYATEWRDRLVNCVNDATKQAQIDVLNKAKEKIVEHMREREYMGVKYKQGVFSESEIDELIKEVQNGEDKG